MLTASLSTAGSLLSAPLRAIAMKSISPLDGTVLHSSRLDAGWQFHRGAISAKGVWGSAQSGPWEAVELPHCFNALNECDPAQPYFRGQGWYRTRLLLTNPFADGRTILHFQGAGQTTALWVGSTLIATHVGGYDEFAFDITEAVKRLSPAEIKDGVPIAVCCDNTPDHERIPSELSDFCLYGGLYRHVNLVYLPLWRWMRFTS